MTSSAFVLLALPMMLVTLCKADTDQTRNSGTSGTSIVEAVIDVIKAKCILSDDHQFLRHLAYVESLDGTDADTYQAGYNGGIWKVSQSMLGATTSCPTVIQKTCEIIKQEFNIDWTTVTWSDLRKPLYSGLAAALYVMVRTGSSSSGIPSGLHEQANFWAQYYHSGSSQRNFTAYAELADQFTCDQNMDLAFIIDSSGSIVDSDFLLGLDFFVKVVQTMNLPHVVRVSALTFDDVPDVKFHFNSFTTKNEVLDGIYNITRGNGSTATDQALDAARNDLFTVANGARPSGTTKRVAVLITDGQSNFMSLTLEAAKRLRDAGVTVFSIGVGGYDPDELNGVASSPNCTHVYTLNSYPDIPSIITELQRSTCRANTQVARNETFTGVYSERPVTFTVQPEGTLVIDVECGTAEIFVSYTNPIPSTALYSGRYVASPSHPAYISPDVNAVGRPLYLTVLSSHLLGSSCPFAYTISDVPTHWEVKCCVADQCGPCTADQLRQNSHLREVVCYSGQLDFPNPCTRDALEAGNRIFAYPFDSSRFIRCDYGGNPYVTQCPHSGTFNPSTLSCGYNTPGITTLLRLPDNYPNPCTPERIQAQYFFFEYTPDRRYYIHCDPWGNAYLQRCPELEVWSQAGTICMDARYFKPEVPVTTRAPVVISNPCTPEALSTGRYFFPYPCDHSRFIHCDISGNYWVQNCPGGMFFDPATFICLTSDPQSGAHGCD